MTRIKKAVFPVGGLGTRFLPATKAIPKEMLPVLNKPLVQYAVEEALAAGIEQILFVTGRNKNAITNHFDSSYELENSLASSAKNPVLEKVVGWLPEPGNVFFTRQRQPLGLGHAIWCARNFISEGEAFAVLLADEFFLPDTEGKTKSLSHMLDLYEKNQAYSIAVDRVELEKTKNYGIVKTQVTNTSGMNYVSGSAIITDIVEKPQVSPPSQSAVVGRYVLPYSIFSALEKTEPGSGNEIQLTDAIKQDLAKNQYHAVEIQDERVDCGNEFGLLEANVRIAMRNAEYRSRLQDLVG